MTSPNETKVGEKRNYLLIGADIASWISIFILYAAAFRVLSGPATFPPGTIPPLPFLVFLGDLVPFLLGLLWLVLRSSRRYTDEKERLQKINPTLTPNWFRIWAPLVVVGAIFFILQMIFAGMRGHGSH